MRVWLLEGVVNEMSAQGIIRSIIYARGSGLAEVELEVDGKMVRVPADAGPTFRALRSAFGDKSPIGHTISYETDDLGLLVGFDVEDE